jgi:hypothetical protein
MSTPNQDGHKPEKQGANGAAGFEQSDVRIRGVIVFLTAMAVFIAVAGLVAYGVGKVINARLNKEDGPPSKWTKSVDVRQLGNMPSNPALQNKMAGMTQNFPTPRVQTDDGSEDISELHAREQLLLDNYSWVDPAQGKVRLPIGRAMALIAERGLPVVSPAKTAPPMTGDKVPAVPLPLTGGFAPTAYEQAQAETAKPY